MEICSLDLNRDEYRAITSDYEYIDNWVDKLDLLCMPKAELGFLGSCFFIGVMFSIYYIPRLSDEYGRLTYIK